MGKQENIRVRMILTAVCVCSIFLSPAAFERGQSSGSAPAPIDPQQVQDQDLMPWADYRPIPGRNWANPTSAGSCRRHKGRSCPPD